MASNAEEPRSSLPEGDDPLPQAALDTLAWIDDKDVEIARLTEMEDWLKRTTLWGKWLLYQERKDS